MTRSRHSELKMDIALPLKKFNNPLAQETCNDPILAAADHIVDYALDWEMQYLSLIHISEPTRPY